MPPAFVQAAVAAISGDFQSQCIVTLFHTSLPIPLGAVLAFNIHSIFQQGAPKVYIALHEEPLPFIYFCLFCFLLALVQLPLKLHYSFPQIFSAASCYFPNPFCSYCSCASSYISSAHGRSQRILEVDPGVLLRTLKGHRLIHRRSYSVSAWAFGFVSVLNSIATLNYTHKCESLYSEIIQNFNPVLWCSWTAESIPQRREQAERDNLSSCAPHQNVPKTNAGPGPPMVTQSAV